VSTGAKARFRDWQMGEIGAKTVDRVGYLLELGRGWRSGIIYKS
jgi:hypothetical protein